MKLHFAITSYLEVKGGRMKEKRKAVQLKKKKKLNCLICFANSQATASQFWPVRTKQNLINVMLCNVNVICLLS